ARRHRHGHQLRFELDLHGGKVLTHSFEPEGDAEPTSRKLHPHDALNGGALAPVRARHFEHITSNRQRSKRQGFTPLTGEAVPETPRLPRPEPRVAAPAGVDEPEVDIDAGIPGGL